MQTAFIYSPEFGNFTYGPKHPLKPIRMRLTYELANAYGLLQLPQTRLIPAQPCTEEDLAVIHSVNYIEAVRFGAELFPEWDLMSFGLGTEENPIFPAVYEHSLLAVGASLQAARLVAGGEVAIAFNIAGGQHHASRNHASGFCYFNDIALVIQYLVNQGYRVAYVDIDAHHGDGVQEFFYRTKQVLTISLHESGQYLFPWSGYEREIGVGEGKGYTVNVPLLPHSDDEIFYRAFQAVVPPLLACFQPDVLVTQLGVDSFHTDPLSTLSVTTNSFGRIIAELKRLSPGKWVALGGGGYDILHVPRAWTLAWAIMNDVELPDQLPEAYENLLHTLRLHNDNRQLRDAPLRVKHARQQKNLNALETTLHYLREHQFKIICGQ